MLRVVTPWNFTNLQIAQVLRGYAAGVVQYPSAVRISHDPPLEAMLLRDRQLWQRGSSLQLQRLPFQVCFTEVEVLYGLEVTSFAKAKGRAVDEEFHMPRPSSLAIQALDDQIH